MKSDIIKIHDRIDYVLPNQRGLHRADGPARTYTSGKFEGEALWYLHGTFHRYYGPFNSLDDVWCIHGKGVLRK